MSQEKKQDSLIEISDEEFIESFTSKKQRRKQENILDLNYLAEEVKTVFIYPLTTLTGKSTAQEIQISSEKTTIMVTTPDKGQKVKVYLEETLPYDLNEFVDPTNPTEQLIKNTKDLNLTTLNFKNIDFNLLYLLTFEQISETNFGSLKKYLGKTIIPNIETGQSDMTFVPIKEFSNSFKSQPIEIILTEPIIEKIKEIHIKSPVGALIGNIKPINIEGKQPDLLAKEGTEIFPKLVFPFQIQPQLATVEYWASKQIIPFNEIFEFLKEKNIKFNEKFSLAEFLRLGQEIIYQPLHVDHAKEINWDEKGKVDDGDWQGLGNGSYVWNSKEPKDYSKNMKVTIGTKRWNSTSKAPNGIQTQDLYEVVDEINNVNVISTTVGKTTDAFQTLCLMLTESFWKDMEFEGGVKSSKDKNDQWVTKIIDGNIYDLQEKYAGQDRYAVTTNVWIAWKRKNPDLINDNPEIIKRIENTIAMLSGAVKSNYSINKGDNDDYKILLPYYFEIQNKLDNPIGWVSYQDVIVKLKSNYGEFTEAGFKFNYKNIAKSNIFELEYNHFAFPEMTKIPETAAIPSSMPVDQQLANGEYSKYLVTNFAQNQSKKELYLKRYGSGNMRHDSISESLDNEGEFELNNAININELEISAFYGYGNWKITFITEAGKKQETKQIELNLNLFDKNANKTLVNLVL